MKNETGHEIWLAIITENDSVLSASKRIGVPQRTLANHVKNDALTYEEVASLCRAYGVNVIDGLLLLGWLDRDEIRDHAKDYSARILPLRDLVNALAHRLKSLSEASDEEEEVQGSKSDFARLYDYYYTGHLAGVEDVSEQGDSLPDEWALAADRSEEESEQ